MDWFLYDNGLRHERIKSSLSLTFLRLERRVFLKNFEKYFFDILIPFEKIFPGNI